MTKELIWACPAKNCQCRAQSKEWEYGANTLCLDDPIDPGASSSFSSAITRHCRFFLCTVRRFYDDDVPSSE